MALVYCDSCMSVVLASGMRERPFYCDSCLAQSAPLPGAPKVQRTPQRRRGLLATLWRPVDGLARRIDRLLRRKYRA